MTAKLYIRKERVLLETPITEFHEKFYILEIRKLSFHFTHLCILGTYHYLKERRGSFKRRVNLHDVLCRRYYSERYYPVFLIKSNRNIMVAIGMYLFTELPYNKSVHHPMSVHFWYKIMCHVMR